MTTPALPVPRSLAERLTGSPRLILLDVDGTLAPIAPTPDRASVPDETREVVSALARRPGTHVAIVSGRGAADASRLVGVSGLWVIGNHGFEVVEPSGAHVVDPRVAPHLEGIEEAARRLTPYAAAIPGAFVEDKRFTLSVHYRLADRAAIAALRDEVQRVADALALRTMNGKELVEVRPPVAVDKGTASLSLAESLGVPGPTGSVLYAGDDRTDEDAFRALRRASPRTVTIHVGGDEATMTDAEYSLADTSAMHELLVWLLARS